jgi:2-phospho-L-lactate guanylyltransferase
VSGGSSGAAAAFSVVIPVKGTQESKSRLGAGPSVALAIALDTVAACVAAHELDPSVVARVVVVTVAAVAPDFAALEATVLQDTGHGLNAAIGAALAHLEHGPVAVLLGDLPALQPDELLAALRLAGARPLAFVADADEVGTTLITALDARDHRPAFGERSRAAHLEAGYLELDVPMSSGLRLDVDTQAQLASLRPRLGPRTTAALP